MINSYETRQRNTNFATLGANGYESTFQEVTGFATNVDMEKMSGLKETAQYSIYKMQPKLIGKYFDVNNPIGF